jgi:hypothetical protein
LANQGIRTNISFPVVVPAVIGHASHAPSPAPGFESQSAWTLQLAATLPETHATGVHFV